MSTDLKMELKLKLLRGKDIRAFNFFQPLSIYVAASISSTDPDTNLDQAQKQRTPADKEGDGSPEWNHELRFDLNGIHLRGQDIFLRIDLLHEGGIFGDRQIGEVRVPLSHFVEHDDGVVRLGRYQVNGPDGKPNGVLTFCYKINRVVEESSGWSIIHHRTESEKPRPGIIQYPTLGELDYSVPPPYYQPPESYYAPPPPLPVVYPTQPYPAVWPPSPPVHHHHHHYHHHHHSWSHFSYSDDGGRWPSLEEGEGWSRDPYGPPR